MRNFKNVPRILFGRGSYRHLADIVADKRRTAVSPQVVYLVDDVFRHRATFPVELPDDADDIIQWANVAVEPRTDYVDQLTTEVRQQCTDLPAALVGIGGGSTLDITKAVSIMLTNPGRSQDYQGWDLPKEPPVFKVGIPTLSGTGAEVSRTCVLVGPEKKLGINSDYSVFDQIVLDPDLLAGVPQHQRVFSGMDCYVHSVEALQGGFKNAFSQSYAEKGLDLCKRVFLEGGNDDDLMTASYFGGCSIAYSEVGVCHALSYGLSLVLGYRHGEANCLVFNHLDDFYPDGVGVFREILRRNQIELAEGVMQKVTEEQMQRMVAMTLRMEKPLTNALGERWRDVMTERRIRELYYCL